MGNAKTKLDAHLKDLPLEERYFGLENFGNTCYCNSVLQALFFCEPLREHLLKYADERAASSSADETLLTCLADLFKQIRKQKKRTGVFAPRRFVSRLRKDNDLFGSLMHQDAHEFLNFLLNQCSELLDEEARSNKENKAKAHTTPREEASGADEPSSHGKSKTDTNFIQELFKGEMESQTKCMWCEAITKTREAFMDLSIDIEHNWSVSACLRNFAQTETLHGREKFHCDECAGLQEAERHIKINKPPRILALHLKRFKFVESLGRFVKLMHRVAFPTELRLGADAAQEEHSDDLYSLFAIVVHSGSGPHHGHYVALVKSGEKWILFDDERVGVEDVASLQHFFGSTPSIGSSTDNGYILFFQRLDESGDAGRADEESDVNDGDESFHSGHGCAPFHKDEELSLSL